jgi:hypothetical protein
VTEQTKETPAFEKEVVQLPDGRELTYYRFREEAPRTPDHAPAPGPAKKKER